MTDQTWPAPTPRDEVFARVVTRGRRIQMINRLVTAAAAVGVATVAGVGVWLGASGTISLVGERAGVDAPVLPTGSGTVSYVACPGEQAIGELRSGDRVFLTGRDASGDWVELRAPEDVAIPVWVRAEVVDPDGAADLPEVECTVAEGALPSTSSTTVADDEPEEELPEGETTTTVVEDGEGEDPGPTTTTTASPVTTPPTTQPTTTTSPADTQGPSITDLQRTNPLIREGAMEFCPDASLPTSTSVSAQVADPSGVQSVRVHWSFVLGGSEMTGSQPMSLAGGRYRATVDFSHVPGNSNDIVNINWSVRAVDGRGNARTVASGPNDAVELQGC